MLRELVNVSLRYGGTTAMTLYAFQTGPETFTVDMAIDRPEGLADAEVETTVTRDGKEEGRMKGTFAKDQPIVGRLILKPGDYVVESSVSDRTGKPQFKASDVLHIKPRSDTFTVSDVLFFRSASAVAPAAPAAFSYAGYQFDAAPRKQFHPADKLQILFQIAASTKIESNANGKVTIDYTIAGVNNSTRRWTFHDDLAMDRFDANGLLLNSKTMSIRDLTAGRYFLVILATDPAGHRASQTVSFEVIETSD
jgi:hypothetical protein